MSFETFFLHAKCIHDNLEKLTYGKDGDDDTRIVETILGSYLSLTSTGCLMRLFGVLSRDRCRKLLKILPPEDKNVLAAFKLMQIPFLHDIIAEEVNVKWSPFEFQIYVEYNHLDREDIEILVDAAVTVFIKHPCDFLPPEIQTTYPLEVLLEIFLITPDRSLDYSYKIDHETFVNILETIHERYPDSNPENINKLRKEASVPIGHFCQNASLIQLSRALMVFPSLLADCNTTPYTISCRLLDMFQGFHEAVLEECKNQQQPQQLQPCLACIVLHVICQQTELMTKSLRPPITGRLMTSTLTSTLTTT